MITQAASLRIHRDAFLLATDYVAGSSDFTTEQKAEIKTYRSKLKNMTEEYPNDPSKWVIPHLPSWFKIQTYVLTLIKEGHAND